MKALEAGQTRGGSQASSSGSLGVGTWHWRPDGGNVTWTAGVYELLQQPPLQPPSWELWLEQVHPEDRSRVASGLAAAVELGARETLHYRLIRRDGSTIWIEDRRHMDGDGTCHGVFIDVTSAVPHDRSANEKASPAHRALEEAGIGFLFCDFESGEYHCNDALHAICGWSGSPLILTSDHLLPAIHPEDVETVRRRTAKSRACGGPVDVEYRITTAAGEQRWLRERGHSVRMADGQSWRYCSVIQDISVEKQRLTAFEENRSLLTLSLGSNDIGVWEWNRTTGQQIWNDTLFEILGYEPGGGTPGQEMWKAVLHPEDRDWASKVFEAERQSGVQAFTYRIITSGKVRWVRESWKEFVTEDGSEIRLGVSADVTDWKEREHRLLVADRWLTLAVSGGRIGLWSQDDTMQVCHWNDCMFNLLGYQAGEIEPSAQAWRARIHPTDAEGATAAPDSAGTEGGEVVKEYRILLPGNVERWVEERGSAKDIGSSVRHGVLFDITERKLFQQELEASQQRLQLALETGQMGFWSGQGTEETWDERTFRLLGYGPFSVKASREAFMRVLHPDDRLYVLAAEEKLWPSGADITQEYRIVRPDGAVRWIESRRKLTTSGKPDRFGVVVDVTDRKSREELRLTSQRLEAAGQLLRGLAHDFNNFLAVIVATLDSITGLGHDQATARRLQEARQAAMAGAVFSRRLINISRSREWRPQILPVGEHISRLAETIEPLLKRHIALSVAYPDDLWPVHADPLECDSAIINLLINARDAIPVEGTISITVSNEHANTSAASAPAGAAEFVLITVSDTGRGMDRSTLRKATEPFFTTKPEGAGTGLGLSSVAAFAAAAGGILSIDSEPGKGTTVSLALPRASGEGVSIARAQSNAPRGNGERVLAVDDDAFVRESTMQRLESLGYAVEECSDGVSAIATLHSDHEIALVLSDISMQGPLNGFDLRERLALEMPHIPVLLITAHEELVGRDEHVLSKSCSQLELACILAASIENGKNRIDAQTGTRETGDARR